MRVHGGGAGKGGVLWTILSWAAVPPQILRQSTLRQDVYKRQVDDIMKQFGISDQDLEAMEERFAGMMENGDMDPAAMMQQLGPNTATFIFSSP